MVSSWPPEAQAELTRLKNEVHAKDETLNQLKLKTKAFVDNMRNELAVEKKRVGELQDQLKQQEVAMAASAPSSSTGSNEAALKQEIEALTQRDHEMKARAKTFADTMKTQLQAEQAKTQALEQQLQEKVAALALAQAASNSSANLLDFGDAPKSSEELTTLQTQLQTATQELENLRERLRTAEVQVAQHAQEATTAQRELEGVQFSNVQRLSQMEDEILALKAREQELEQALDAQRNSQGNVEASLAIEHSQFKEMTAKNDELVHKLQQYKIESEHLQKQLLDRDFQLEQLNTYRQRAEESETQTTQLRGELVVLQAQLETKTQEMLTATCSNCGDLKREVAELSSLYEKVNMGRSQSDLQLAEAHSELSALRSIKQTYVAAKERLEDISKENMHLQEKNLQHEAEISTLKTEVQRLRTEATQLQSTIQATKSDSFERQQQSDSVMAEKRKIDEDFRILQTRFAQSEKRNQELATTIETINRENNDKRQKAKALVMSLTSEKQTLAEIKNELQKEVDRLRMELNQRNVENEKRLKQLNEENSLKVQQSATTLQNLTDEISTLKQTLTILQESEKNQQRAKELTAAKREIEDSNKKRLAAKAETQKLALELESMQKCLTQISEHTTTQCTANVRTLSGLQDRVNEALQVLEKRAAAAASAQGKKLSTDPASPRGQKVNINNNTDAEDVRGPESASSSSSVRNQLMSPTAGAKKVEESIARVNERLSVLVEVTEKLCDLSMEQNDVSLKDVVMDKVTQLFTQCFSEKLRAAYSKVSDEGEMESSSNQLKH